MGAETTGRNRPSFPILRVVEKYLEVQRRGSNHVAICPFHQDSNPSLYISEEKNIFKCFSCNASGDAVGFVMRKEGCGYSEAVMKIGKLLSMDVSRYLNPQELGRDSLVRLNKYISEIFQRCLFDNAPGSKAALDYLTKTRRLRRETLEKYSIGYAPSEDILEKALELYSRENRLSEETIRESGLFLQTNEGTRRPFFRGRIIFPIHDGRGRTIGFCGRGESPKYLNLRNNSLFSRNGSLFNLHRLQEEKPIHLFEGFLDLMKVDQELALTNGVACMGGSLAETAFPPLKALSNRLILCFDNDGAGIRFTQEMARTLVTNGFEVEVVDLLERREKDIDEVVDRDPRDAQRRIGAPVGFFPWLHRVTKPKDLVATKLLADECLDLLVDDQMRPRPRVPIQYAKESIEGIFDWYLETPEHREMNLGGQVEELKKQYIAALYRNSMANRTAVAAPKEVADDFTRLAIKYQGLVAFSRREEMGEWMGYRRFEWAFELSPDLMLESRALGWILLYFSDENPVEREMPEVLKKNSGRALEIREESDFFNRYYSFYREYLNCLSSFYINNELWDPVQKMEKIFLIRETVAQLEKKSSDFFAVSDFCLKNPE